MAYLRLAIATFALTSLANTALASAQPQDGNGQRAAWYDVRSIVSAMTPEPAGIDMRLHVSSSFIDRLEPDSSFDVQAGFPQLTGLDCLAAIERGIEQTPGADLASVEVFRGRVQITGNESAHASAANTVKLLRALTASPVRLEITRLPANQLPVGSSMILSAQEAQELIGSLPNEMLDGPTTTVHSLALDRPTLIGRESRTAFVADFDVEAAQSAVAVDPVISIVKSGLQCRATVHPASNGQSWMLRFEGRDGVLTLPIETIALPAFAGGAIELPESSTALFAASGELRLGGALVVQHGAPTFDALIIRLLANDEALPSDAPIVRFGNLAMPRRSLPLPRISAIEPSGGDATESTEFHERASDWDDAPPSLAVLVSEYMQRRDLVSLSTQIGTRALIVGPADAAQSLQRRVDSLGEVARPATLSFEIAYAAVPPRRAKEVIAGDFVEFAKSANRIGTAGLDGDTVILTSGVEHAYLMDHDVRIANGASISDPIVRAAFRGIRFWCTTSHVSEDTAPEATVSGWFDITHSIGSGDERTVNTISYHPAGGEEDDTDAAGSFESDLPLELGATHLAGQRAFLTVPVGEWRLLACDAFTSNPSRTFVAAIRVKRVD